MHLERRLRCIVFLYSSRPEPANASARCLDNHITLRHTLETPSSMYCVVISHYANASERQRAMIGKNTSLPDMHLKRFFQCCVAIPKRAKASERQRAMIAKTYDIQTCTWNGVFNVLRFSPRAVRCKGSSRRKKNLQCPLGGPADCRGSLSSRSQDGP